MFLKFSLNFCTHAKFSLKEWLIEKNIFCNKNKYFITKNASFYNLWNEWKPLILVWYAVSWFCFYSYIVEWCNSVTAVHLKFSNQWKHTCTKLLYKEYFWKTEWEIEYQFESKLHVLLFISVDLIYRCLCLWSSMDWRRLHHQHQRCSRTGCRRHWKAMWPEPLRL